MAKCLYCFHRERDEIDRCYVGNIAFRKIIARFGGSLGTAHRHKEHVRDLLKARTQDEREEHSSALLQRVLRLADEAEKILAAASSKNNFRGANGALGAAAKLLDLCARLSGELQSQNAGGIHLTRITNNTVNLRAAADDDREIATMFAEFTNGFDADRIAELKQLVASTTGAQPDVPR